MMYYNNTPRSEVSEVGGPHPHPHPYHDHVSGEEGDLDSWLRYTTLWGQIQSAVANRSPTSRRRSSSTCSSHQDDVLAEISRALGAQQVEENECLMQELLGVVEIWRSFRSQRHESMARLAKAKLTLRPTLPAQELRTKVTTLLQKLPLQHCLSSVASTPRERDILRLFSAQPKAGSPIPTATSPKFPAPTDAEDDQLLLYLDGEFPPPPPPLPQKKEGDLSSPASTNAVSSSTPSSTRSTHRHTAATTAAVVAKCVDKLNVVDIDDVACELQAALREERACLLACVDNARAFLELEVAASSTTSSVQESTEAPSLQELSQLHEKLEAARQLHDHQARIAQLPTPKSRGSVTSRGGGGGNTSNPPSLPLPPPCKSQSAPLKGGVGTSGQKPPLRVARKGSLVKP